MTPAELREIGERLYGKRWQGWLAERLPVTTRTIRHWLAGKYQIREVIARRIRSLETKEGDRA